jgi:hypothetical protein
MKVFLITPFTPESAGGEPRDLFDIVQKTVRDVVRRAGLTLVHPKEMSEGGFIMDQILSEILSSDLVIAILTGKSAHEVALAISAQKALLLVARSSDDLYFDVRHMRCLTYGGAGELNTFPGRLGAGIGATMAQPSSADQPRQLLRSPDLLHDATALFIGPTRRGPQAAIRVGSKSEFFKIFGAPLPSSKSYFGYAVCGFFDNGGTDAWIIRVVGKGATSAYADLPIGDATQSLRVSARSSGEWGNRIALHLMPGTRAGVRLRVGIDLGAQSIEDLVTRTDQEDYDNLGLTAEKANYIVDFLNNRSDLVNVEWVYYTSVIEQSDNLRIRLTGGYDGTPPGSEDYLQSAESMKFRIPESIDDVATVCVPDCVHPLMPEKDQRQIEQSLIAHCERSDCVCILATPPSIGDLAELKPIYDTEFATVYFPWLRVTENDGSDTNLIPPVGHIAGLFARHDQFAGVHLAPIDMPIAGTSIGNSGPGALGRTIDKHERDTLRRLGINAIYDGDTGLCPVVSTALTLAIDEHLQPLNRRRLTNYIARHLRRLLVWTADKENAVALWSTVEKQVSTFLMDLWRAGALLGNPEEAFFVRCGLHRSMTQNDVDNGRLIILLGFAPNFEGGTPLSVTLPPFQVGPPRTTG